MLLARMLAKELARSDGNPAHDVFSAQGFHLLRKHFYVPVPDEGDLPGEFWDQESSLPGLEIDPDACMQWYRGGPARYLEEFRATYPIERPQDGGGFWLLNGGYMAVDAHVYYTLVRHLKPRRIVEIGAGNSTLLSAAACLKNKEETGRETQLTLIEPYPWDIFKDGVAGVSELLMRKVQDVPLEVFESLGEGDILFIDSSHVLRMGNDVQFEYLEVLPRLAPGVYVHVHDISLPRPYPKVYFDNQLYWNEQYLLQAFLALNSAFEISWPSNYLMLKRARQMHETFPEIARMREHYPSSEPTSFWMRRHA